VLAANPIINIEPLVVPQDVGLVGVAEIEGVDFVLTTIDDLELSHPEAVD
jgi:hypothetical protein